MYCNLLTVEHLRLLTSLICYLVHLNNGLLILSVELL